MGSTLVGGSENYFSEYYFQLENSSLLFTLHPSHQNLFIYVLMSSVINKLHAVMYCQAIDIYLAKLYNAMVQFFKHDSVMSQTCHHQPELITCLTIF